MTIASSIITDAYRESNIIALSASPSTAQVTEALRRLNAILLSTVGNEAGDGLTEYNIEGNYTDESLTSPWIPDNARLMFSNTVAKEYNLDPYPKEGQRFAVVDVLGNFATYNVVINGNGRRIEDADSLTLDTDGLYRQWLYRSDIGGWVRVAALVSTDEMPFPQDFDDYFIVALAFRLNPRYGQLISAETLQAYNRSKRQLAARYNTDKQIRSDLSGYNWLADRQAYGRFYENEFEVGLVYPWR